ncbi:hypothetical protein [Prescottella equi]|uniref:hypothetical protein n=1 Tax=Rhodococcus hoagii TaxID=43767 RepID=UPI0023DA0119|nr:hypothetical protein [Prescottella equi]
MEQYEAGLSLSGAGDLRKELAGQGFVGRDALEAFGQKVVSDIAGERQPSFGGIILADSPAVVEETFMADRSASSRSGLRLAKLTI